MFISPKDAIKQRWITLPGYESLQQWEDAQFVSPNAIDFTIDQLYKIDQETPFILQKTSKIMRKSSKVDPMEGGYWRLEPNSVYDAMSNFNVKLPEGVACMLIVRSTLNRNGLFVTSGLYDSGFQGSLGFAIHNRGGVALIEPGSRVGQIMFIQSDSAGVYAGQYNTKDGQHWSEAVKELK